jgi:hypothetical protein
MRLLFARTLAPVLALAAAPGVLALMSTPAAAQEDGGDRVNTLIIYGADECPKSEGSEIVVCARMDESERFRIPERLRQSGDPANNAWANRVQAFEAVGDFGPMSCTPVGAGSELGCTAKMIEAAYAERAQSSNVRFSQLIAQERDERLATIDAEAAETQARVEELERQYDERIRRAQEGEVAEAVSPAAPPAEAIDPSRAPPADVPLDDGEDGGPQPVDPRSPGVSGL